MISGGFDSDGKRYVVRASGAVTVESAAELKDAFMRALGSGGDIAIDMSGVTEADLSCLQLFCSFCRSVGSLGLEAWVDATSGKFSAAAESAGFGASECAGSGLCLLAGGGHG